MYLNVEFKKSLKNSKLYECNCKGTKIEWMNKQLAKQKMHLIKCFRLQCYVGQSLNQLQKSLSPVLAAGKVQISVLNKPKKYLQHFMICSNMG